MPVLPLVGSTIVAPGLSTPAALGVLDHRHARCGPSRCRRGCATRPWPARARPPRPAAAEPHQRRPPIRSSTESAIFGHGPARSLASGHDPALAQPSDARLASDVVHRAALDPRRSVGAGGQVVRASSRPPRRPTASRDLLPQLAPRSSRAPLRRPWAPPRRTARCRPPPPAGRAHRDLLGACVRW